MKKLRNLMDEEIKKMTKIGALVDSPLMKIEVEIVSYTAAGYCIY